MEATKKTSASKAVILVVAALSMLFSGLSVAAQRVDATPAPACPDGFVLTSDGKACFQAAVITSADNPNTCDKGMLTPDGVHCYEKAQIIPQEGATYCPKGYSIDTSLNGQCARFEKASQKDKTCPDGSFGKAGACYIFQAKVPGNKQGCPTGGKLVGDQCVIKGNAPTRGAGKCPTSDTVFEENGACYSLVTKPFVPVQCDANKAGHNVAPYAKEADGTCKWVFPGSSTDAADNVTCPHGGTMVKATNNGHSKNAYCVNPQAARGACPADTTDAGNNQCSRQVALTGGKLRCEAGYGLVGKDCIRYANPSGATSACPLGSVEDTDGNCRKPVGDQAGAYYCKDSSASLSGKNCVWTTGFLVKPSKTQYKCAAGTRTVIGSGSSAYGDGSTVNVICILGKANENKTTGPSCLKGQLDDTQKFCITARIDSAPATAPALKPNFAG